MRFVRPVAAACLIAAAAAACAPAGGTGPAAQTPAAPEAPPPPPADPLAVGPQEAKDMLYCAALIFAAHPQPASAQSPIEEARRMKAENLALAIGDEGVNALVLGKYVHATHAGVLFDAYARQAAIDMQAGAPRIPVDDCLARAEALPPPSQ